MINKYLLGLQLGSTNPEDILYSLISLIMVAESVSKMCVFNCKLLLL